MEIGLNEILTYVTLQIDTVLQMLADLGTFIPKILVHLLDIEFVVLYQCIICICVWDENNALFCFLFELIVIYISASLTVYFQGPSTLKPIGVENRDQE